MITLDLPEEIEQTIIQSAEKQGITVSELLLKSFYSCHFVELNPYPKGDIRRLKGMIKTPIRATIEEINGAIALGAIHGENFNRN